MESVSQKIIEQAVEVIGTDGIAEDVIETKLAALVSDGMTIRRLIDWIPEAFGLVLASHAGKIIAPTMFSARDANGRYRSIGLKEEPIFTMAIPIAQRLYHDGPINVFQNVAHRSAIAHTLDAALKAGVLLDGATFSGPALIGIPAEIYPDVPKPVWLKLSLKFYSWLLHHTRRRKSA